jgi:hypothetical protein
MTAALPPGAEAFTGASSTLSLLCACLAVRDDDDTLATRLARDAIDWPQVAWLAGNHLVTPSLAGILRRKGLFDRLPDEVQDYLDAIRALNRARNQTLREQLAAIAEPLNRMGLQPVLLKGAIALTPHSYPGAEDRVIGDLDLLVPAERLDEASAAIAALGYRIHYESWQWALPKDRQRCHHGMPLLHPALVGVKLELHRRILEHPGDDARLREGLRTHSLTLDGGPTVLIPDGATRLLHNVLHAQVSDRQRRKRLLNLRQLLEFAALAHQTSPDLKETDLRSRLRPARHDALAEYWAQAERWLGLPIPRPCPAPRTRDANSG